MVHNSISPDGSSLITINGNAGDYYFIKAGNDLVKLGIASCH